MGGRDLTEGLLTPTGTGTAGGDGRRRQCHTLRIRHAENAKKSGRGIRIAEGVARKNRFPVRGPGAGCGGVTQILYTSRTPIRLRRPLNYQLLGLHLPYGYRNIITVSLRLFDRRRVL